MSEINQVTMDEALVSADFNIQQAWQSFLQRFSQGNVPLSSPLDNAQAEPQPQEQPQDIMGGTNAQG